MSTEPWMMQHRIKVIFFVILLTTLFTRKVTSTLRDFPQPPPLRHIRRNRNVQQEKQELPYYRTNDTDVLGEQNFMASIGNPLKGLARFGSRNPQSSSSQFDSVPSAIEFFSIGLDDIMIGDNQFNWTTHDALLNASASRNMHVVLSVFIHWPGEPLRIPPHLIDIPFYETDNGYSPNYGEPRLLTALQQFIFEWGQHIDGDKRILALHIGLLGFWGEGHTYPDNTLVPDTSKQLVAGWYRDAFNQTQIQARYPGPNADGFGLFDASLGFSTLDGAANGGVDVDWFMYPQIVQANQQNSWTDFIIGGETRPELQGTIFTDAYPARTEHNQDLKECIDTLHVSYVLHHGAFENDGYTGTSLERANIIHAYMGYAFHVSEIAVYTTKGSTELVDVSVQLVQAGIAPFYYDLQLQLSCNNGAVVLTMAGAERIIAKGESSIFQFRNIPATTNCLDKVTLSLQSSYAYPTRPIRFAQGNDGTNITFPIPLPPMVKYESPVPMPTATVHPSNSPITPNIILESPTTTPNTITESMIRRLILLIQNYSARVVERWKNMIFN